MEVANRVATVHQYKMLPTPGADYFDFMPINEKNMMLPFLYP
jgi:hypothetical protein